MRSLEMVSQRLINCTVENAITMVEFKAGLFLSLQAVLQTLIGCKCGNIESGSLVCYDVVHDTEAALYISGGSVKILTAALTH